MIRRIWLHMVSRFYERRAEQATARGDYAAAKAFTDKSVHTLKAI